MAVSATEIRELLRMIRGVEAVDVTSPGVPMVVAMASGLEFPLPDEARIERATITRYARWLAESEPRTLHELADEFGVSAERIRQIEAKAMQKMRKQLAATL